MQNIKKRAEQDKFINNNKEAIKALLLKTAGEYNVQMGNNTKDYDPNNTNPYKKVGVAYQSVEPGYSLTSAERNLLKTLEDLDLTPSPMQKAKFQKEFQPHVKGTGPGEKHQDSGEAYKPLSKVIYWGLPGEINPSIESNPLYLGGRTPTNFG